ncbi:hypothetical protein [Siphonobacter curvatus]|uniref:Uncharacterized protein n=1 Tax=Siphonobacter curvatus TaxID=2094562 RepID=A0A2S7IKC4_9BACT|nr:hypothetical protein [Siphonobacter curvatus]PQA58172.1 hypothetical protein C5O19_00375 [Siphonobacter curvatus]
MKTFSYVKTILVLVVASGLLTSCSDLGFLFSPKKNNAVDERGRGDGTGGGNPNPPVIKPASMVYLTSESMKVGFSMDYGGAITYLSPANSSTSIINNFDLGRQLQYAYYSYPLETYKPNGVSPHPAWAGMGWDPIQTGDVYGNGSRVIERRVEGNKLYFKTIPMQWAFNNVPCECTVETYVELKGNVLEMRNVLQMNRTDSYSLVSRGQDIAGGFLTSDFTRGKAYWGLAPFTNAPLTDIDLVSPPFTNGTTNSIEMYLPENWTYIYNDKGVGLGMWVPSVTYFSTEMMGRPNIGDEFSGNTGRIGAHMNEVLDRNLRYESKFAYILGTAEQTRQYALEHKSEQIKPDFNFSKDRQHWNYFNEIVEAPFNGEWNIDLDNSLASLWSPDFVWDTRKDKKLYIQMAYDGSGKEMTIVGFRQNSSRLSDYAHLETTLKLTADGQYHTYEVNIGDMPEWQGMLRKIIISVPKENLKGKRLKIKTISTNKPS